MQTDANNDWLTVEEAADILRVKTRTLLLWARQGKVRGFILSGTKRHVWRFRRADLDAALHRATGINGIEVVPSQLPSVLARKGVSQ
jgi:excisionase family DNA binding protein